MKILWLHAEKDYYKRYLNNKNNREINVSPFNDSFFDFDELTDQCKKKKIQLFFYTKDINLSTVDYFVFEELPDFKNSQIKSIFNNAKMKILIQKENEIINQKYENQSIFKKFNYVFTWNNELLNKKGFYRFYKGINFDLKIKKSKFFEDKKLVSFIINNKIINNRKSLFPERLRVIRWFNKNYPKELDLYGGDWDKFYISGPKIIRIFNRISFLTKIFKYNLFVYKGIAEPSLEGKLDIMKDYKFHFAFENACLNGWITEKIFHAFLAKSVPIYFGAPNIEKFIPKDCFINYKNFKNINDLYLWIKNIKKDRYNDYLNAAEKYMSSKKKDIFSLKNNISNFTNFIKKLE